MKYVVVAVGALWAASSGAFAQSGAALLLKPWAEGSRAELSADAMVMSGDRDVEVSGFDVGEVGIQWYEGMGRTRFDPAAEGGLVVGFETSHLEFDYAGEFPFFPFELFFPDRLVDHSVGVGFGIGEWEDWQVSATLGVGAAGDELDHAESLYGIGNLIFTKRIDERKAWQVIINYNGNRTFLPDVPLPGIAFTHELSDTFTYVAGVPFSSIHWEFLPAVTLDAQYGFPYTMDVRVGWQVIEPVELFGSFQNRFNRYRYEITDEFTGRENQHLLFEQRRLEAGVLLTLCECMQVTLAGGYAFDQELTVGWDSRDNEDLFEIDSGVYWRVGGALRF